LPTNLLSPTDRLERHLLILAGGFLGIFSLILTLSNAVRLHTWQTDYRWSHWIGFAIWVGVAWLVHRQLAELSPDRDPFLFPIAALLSGWGLLTIWRISSTLAVRQAVWLLLIGMVIVLALRFNIAHQEGGILSYLRRFKYVWLTFGLLLTATTLILGTNPLGAGPRLWLGCCGVYFQPSEPLKLLLIVYLAAYLADRQTQTASKEKLLPLLTPTLIMTSLALLLLLFQRDLGTAVIFMALYAVIIYAGTDKKAVIFASLAVLLVAAIAGFYLFSVVNQRVEAWINPWIDPSGRSYQIVQSLLAVANGGLFGRGIGMGNPNLVPIAQSDFIFSAISEETGLAGAFGIIGLLALLVNRGMRTALKAGDPFKRLLAIGLIVHLVGQSILIIAGNLRLLPLTGVTLPFVSYGGSSLLVSFIELLCLLLISASHSEFIPNQVEKLKQQTRLSLLLSGGLMLGIAGIALTAGWWSLVRGPDLLTRTDNPRRAIADRYVKRGSILDRHEQPLAQSTGQPGDYIRQYTYPALGPLVGYTDPAYGQAGLEASLDPYLRGLQGYPTLTTWWEHLLYGQPPPGLNVRLSIDLDLQKEADQLLAGHKGALVLLNADTGEVLAISSSPTFDANTLAVDWESLVSDPNSPLYDRATMGLYPPGNILGAFILAAGQQSPSAQYWGSNFVDCSLTPRGNTWAEIIAAGCSEPLRQLVNSADNQAILNLLDELGLFNSPTFPVETLSSTRPETISDMVAYINGIKPDASTGAVLKVSPLQMALATASLSNGGLRPEPRLAMAVDTPQTGWVMLPEMIQPQQALRTESANAVSQALAIGDSPIWQVVSTIREIGVNDLKANSGYSWYLGGTLPDWQGASLVVAVALEEASPKGLEEIGRQLLLSILTP
jgi:cell division protein FtsW (lipid II flippase)